MSAATQAPAAEHRCSCGRTFAHEISLKRHCWVTGHSAEESPVVESAPTAKEAVVEVVAPIELPSVPTLDAVDEAVRILREKQKAQMSFEIRQARERQVRAALEVATVVVQQSVQKAAESSRQGAEVVCTSMMLALRMVLMVLVCGSLVMVGMGLGRMLATPAQAESTGVPSVKRQLVGFQSHR